MRTPHVSDVARRVEVTFSTNALRIVRDQAERLHVVAGSLEAGGMPAMAHAVREAAESLALIVSGPEEGGAPLPVHFGAEHEKAAGSS